MARAAGSLASIWSTGRLNARDLPLAVPVVTIVWPRCTASNASAWCDQSDSIPVRSSDSTTAGWRPSGRGVATPFTAPSRALATSWPSAALSSTGCPRSVVSTGALGPRGRAGMIRAFDHREFPLEVLRERKRETVTVVLPAREVADTIGPIVDRLLGLGDLIDQVLVVASASADGSAEVAARHGAEVHQEAELVPEFGQVLGKGDAMWRALSVARGELVVYLDSDTREF